MPYYKNSHIVYGSTMLNNLNDLAMLVSVADSKGFSAAARVHNTSPATLSKQVARIEKELGIRLFNRNTRHLIITEEGQEFVSRVRMALEILDDAQAEISQQEGLRGQLNITAPFSLGHRYIAPIVAKFCEQHPNLRIDLRLTDHVIDLYSQGIDIAIRVGHLPDSNLIAKHLATNQRVLVASPLYMKKNGNLDHPQQLTEHQCLLFSYPGYKQNRWTLSHKEAQKHQEEICVNGLLSSDNGDTLRLWCLLGQGITLREKWEVAQDIQAGKLCHLLPDWEELSVPISVLYRQQTSKKVREFVQYITHYWENFKEIGHR